MVIERSSLFSAPNLRLNVGVRHMRIVWTNAQIDAVLSPMLVNLASFKRKIASRAAPCIASDSHQSFLIADILLLFFILHYYCNYFLFYTIIVIIFFVMSILNWSVVIWRNSSFSGLIKDFSLFAKKNLWEIQRFLLYTTFGVYMSPLSFCREWTPRDERLPLIVNVTNFLA